MKILSKSLGKLSFSIFLAAALFVMLLSFAESKKTAEKITTEKNTDPKDGPGEIDEIYNNCHGRLSKKGVEFIKQHFVYHNNDCRHIPEDGGGLWRCTYNRGLVVYNCFKRCRGSVEATRYFLGLSGGDCDAFRIVNNKKIEVCYPDQAQEFLRDYGLVIAIERIDQCLH